MTDTNFEPSKLRKLTADVRAMRMRSALAAMRMKGGFNPNQPRIPRGSTYGGRWTDGTGSAPAGSTTSRTFRDRTGEASWLSYTNTHRLDGSLLSTVVRNRDGSRIFSDHSKPGVERNTVTMGGDARFTFETRENVVKVFDSGDREISRMMWRLQDTPPEIPLGQPFGGQTIKPFDISPLVGAGSLPPIVAGSILFDWLSSSEKPNRKTLYGVRAVRYTRAGESFLTAAPVVVSREEAKGFCPRLPEVEQYAAEASNLFDPRSYESMAVRGSHMHRYVKDKINGPGKVPQDPSFAAEISEWKTKWANSEIPAYYGAKDTIRVDVLEKRDDKTICFYDMKTGRSYIGMTRLKEIFQTASMWHHTATNIIIVEVKVE